MKRVREVVELALAARNRAKIKVRQPLRTLFILEKPDDHRIPEELWAIAKEELNILELRFVSDFAALKLPRVSPDFRKLDLGWDLIPKSLLRSSGMYPRTGQRIF
jgi:hypothetical protein